MNSGLALKANISDVSRTIADVVASLDGKLSVEDCQGILKDYALTDDVQYLLANKIGKDEIRSLTENKISLQDFRREMDMLDDKLTDLYNETQRKLSTVVTQREFQSLNFALDQKVDISHLNQELESKADKQIIEKALSKKLNRGDIDSVLVKKADLVQNL